MNEWMYEWIIYIYLYIQYKQTYMKITPPKKETFSNIKNIKNQGFALAKSYYIDK